MECAKQGFWSWEYHEFKDILCDSKANHNYSQFAKRQYHKARRRHDEEVIEEQLRDRYASDNVLGWPELDVDPTPLFCYREHNHKVKLGEVA